MEVEKRGTKGGFFQLFDWNVKSRKKLFSSKSESAEISHQGRQNFHGSTSARVQQGLGNGFGVDAQIQNDYHYASSASGDSDYGTKVPGVVARLMGLDSLPTPNINDPCFTPVIESHSFKDSSYVRAAPAILNEHDIVIFQSVRNKLDGLTRNPTDLGLHKVQSRAIERFQREGIPSKSVKPISVSHHRLLSPIKSPGFIPPKNAAYIIEAATKMIEQTPRSTSKSKLPPLGSSSVSVRVCDLKEKMEFAQISSRRSDTSQKGKEHSSVKHMKKQVSGRCQGQSEVGHTYKGHDRSKRIASQRLKDKEKLGSPAVQAKGNFQRRDSVGGRISNKQREHDIISGGSSRNFPNAQKKLDKPSSSRKPSEVLRLNHQKQNCPYTTKEGEVFEPPPTSQPKERKESNQSTNYVNGRTNKTVTKIIVNHVVESRKTISTVADPGKEVSSSSRVKKTSKNKPPISENIQSNGSFIQKSMRNEQSVKCNVEFQGDSKWDSIDNKSSLDVVSFTFTSPVKKSGTGSNSCSSEVPDCDRITGEPGFRNDAVSSSGFAVRGDALSVLLEQKLKELTSRIGLSQEDMSEEGSSNIYGNTGPPSNIVSSLPMNDDTRIKQQEIQSASVCPLVYEGLECSEMNANNESRSETYLDLRGSASVSRLPSFSGASTDSFDVDRSSCEGSVRGLSFESETITWSTTKKSQSTELDIDISDTASSLSIGTASETAALNTMYVKDSSIWELKYIADILSSSELVLDAFALGQVQRIIAPNLFHQLQNQKLEDSDKATEERFLHERKVLFDCVGECLETRCSRLLVGSCRFWAKETAVLCRKQWLAEELYRDISSWTNVEELMVDELVDKDMSSKSGKWIEYEIEAFEEGVEIEKRILKCLVDELIDDFLV